LCLCDGRTQSSNFPTLNAYDPVYNGGMTDAFVTKFCAAGNALVYSTFLGGSSSDTDSSRIIAPGASIAVDGYGCAYVTGQTGSSNFPTLQAYDESIGGVLDAFAAKFSASGDSLICSTFLGGSGIDYGLGIVVDGYGCFYVTGVTFSFDFPTENAYDPSYNGTYDGFVTRFPATGGSLTYSTFLGGSSGDKAFGVAVDGFHSVYVTGETFSCNFPVQNAYDANCGGSYLDAFLTRLSWTPEYSCGDVNIDEQVNVLDMYS